MAPRLVLRRHRACARGSGEHARRLLPRAAEARVRTVPGISSSLWHRARADRAHGKPARPAEHGAHDTRVSEHRATFARRAVGVASHAPRGIARERATHGASHQAQRDGRRASRCTGSPLSGNLGRGCGAEARARGLRRKSTGDDGGVPHAILPADSRRARGFQRVALARAMDRRGRDERRGRASRNPHDGSH